MAFLSLLTLWLMLTFEICKSFVIVLFLARFWTFPKYSGVDFLNDHPNPSRLKADTPPGCNCSFDVWIVDCVWRQAADGRQHISQQWCPQFTVRLRRDGFGGYQDLWLNRKVRIVCIVLAIVWGTMGLYYDDDDVIIMLSNVRVRKMSPCVP